MLDIPLQLWQRVKTGPLWRSLFRHGYPDSRKNQSLAVFTNVFLHLHPVKVRPTRSPFPTRGAWAGSRSSSSSCSRSRGHC